VPEADFRFRAVTEKLKAVESQQIRENRGSFKGAIRIPLRALMFLFNDLAYLCIPRKSLKFLALLFSIPTAPTKLQESKVLIERDGINKAFGIN
jgi:hypothetical protein